MNGITPIKLSIINSLPIALKAVNSMPKEKRKRKALE